MSISYRKLDINLSADKETVLVFGQEMSMLWSNLNGHFDRVFSPRQGT